MAHALEIDPLIVCDAYTRKIVEFMLFDSDFEDWSCWQVAALAPCAVPEVYYHLFKCYVTHIT